MRSFHIRSATILFSALLLSLSPLDAQLLQPGDTVALCGDSITEQRLYSAFIEDYLLMCQPILGVKTHQFGWSGEAINGLRNRVATQVLPFSPTVATTFYGMNDGGYRASDTKNVAKFKQITLETVRLLKKGGVRSILVGSPGAVDSERFKTWRLAKVSPDDYNGTLSDLGAAAREVAGAENVVFVDVHTAMRNAERKAKAKYGADYPFARDGVHPEANGHLVIAYAFLKALGMNGEIGSICYDFTTGRAVVTEGHRIIRSENRRIEIESARYPFCFTDDPKNPESTHAILDCVPFNEELNRFRLLVKNAPARGVKITWGNECKVFTAAQLAVGINLAAEFANNPFVNPFKKVQDAVRVQQEFETLGIKNVLNSIPAMRKNLPEDQAVLDQLAAAVITRSQKLQASAQASVVPVRHALFLEPAP